MLPPSSASTARANETPPSGGCSVATSAAETAACWANIWPEPSSSAIDIDSATTSASCHQPVAEPDHEQVGDRDPERHAEHDLDRPPAALALRQAERDHRRDRREERLRVADDLGRDEPRERRGERRLQDRARGVAQPLGARPRGQPRALGRLLDQRLGALGEGPVLVRHVAETPNECRLMLPMGARGDIRRDGSLSDISVAAGSGPPDISSAMSPMPSSARVVVIGAGIVGNGLACHLARLGWTDIVQLDKGPLPNPGGSTGHASNFIFPVDHSREMTALTLDSVRQYKELDVFTECGGIEVARTEERMEELRRRMASAKSWGVEPVSLVTPAEIKELVPFIDESVIIGGFYSPGVGVVDSLRAGHADARGGAAVRRAHGRRQHRGDRASTSSAAASSACARRAGDIEAETVVIACGVWSPLLARMAGASIPLTPAVHQMIDIGPVPRFEDAKAAIEYPIVRDMDTNMYERQDGRGLEIGSYAHRPILHDPAEIPSIEESALSPTELPFTEDDFDAADGARARADAGDRRRRVGRHQVRDQRPALAHARRAAAARRDARGQGPLVGRRGLGQGGAGRRARRRRVDDARRARDRPAGVRHRALLPVPEDRRARARPRRRGLQQDLRDRPPGRAVGVVRATSGCRRSTRASRSSARCSSRPPAGSARTGTRRTRSCSPSYDGRVKPRDAEWDARWWSPIINAEHLAMRDRAAIFDLTAFCIFDVAGPGALAPCSASRCARWTCRSGASSTRRCSRRAAASAPT